LLLGESGQNGGTTQKRTGGLAIPPTVTTTSLGIVFVPGGTCTVIQDAVEQAGAHGGTPPRMRTVNGWPPRVTHETDGCGVGQFNGKLPKLYPVIMKPIPGGPKGSDKLVMIGPTINGTGPLWRPPDVVTVTGPVVAPWGTTAII